MLGGVLWIVARFFVTFDPAPLSYDGYNRLFTLPLLLLVVGWPGFLLRLRSGLRSQAGSGWAVVLVGLAVMLAGNAIEFWGVLLQDKPNAYAATTSGEEAWVGSHVGWIAFGLGHLLVVIGMVLVGIASRRGDLYLRWRLLPLVIAALGVLWPILSFTAAGDFALMALIGAAWVLLGYSLWSSATAAPVRSPVAAGHP